MSHNKVKVHGVDCISTNTNPYRQTQADSSWDLEAGEGAVEVAGRHRKTKGDNVPKIHGTN